MNGSPILPRSEVSALSQLTSRLAPIGLPSRVSCLFAQFSYYFDLRCFNFILQGLLHVIEGRFGTAVYQYFVLLRYLVILNLVTSFIFIIFLIVPQSVEGTSNEVRIDLLHNAYVIHAFTNYKLKMSPGVSLSLASSSLCSKRPLLPAMSLTAWALFSTRRCTWGYIPTRQLNTSCVGTGLYHRAALCITPPL